MAESQRADAQRATAPQPVAGIAQLKAYVPGRAQLAGRAQLHKLSANENPFGPSAHARAAYRAAARRLHHYPDGSAALLRRALARRYGIEAARIVCGHGSGELLYLLARLYLAPRRAALVSQYGFALYPLAVRMNGARLGVVAEPQRRPDLAAFTRRARASTAMIFLANPNNPTGSFVPLDALQDWHRSLARQTMLVLDYAYGEYLPAEHLRRLYVWARRQNNVVILRSFSKAYGLAALRLGWVYVPTDAAGLLHRLREPFNVSAPAQAAALAALGDDAHLAKVVAHTRHWRARLTQALAALGFAVQAGEGNFLLVQCAARGPRSAARVAQRLERARVLVRALDAYGLPDCLRISIGSAAANRALLRGLAPLGAKPAQPKGRAR